MTNKELMPISEVIETLTEFNRWRRAEGEYGASGIPCPCSPKLIGEAIDNAVKYLKERQNEDGRRR